MSRVAKEPINIQSGVDIKVDDAYMVVKGSKGSLELTVHPLVDVIIEEKIIRLKPKNDTKDAVALAGTMRALINNMVTGVSKGFEKKLQLVGVGYRAALQGKKLNLNLGFSHPVEYALPEGITAEVPVQTEIIIKGADKQKVGQVAAEIRSIRPPEPYKGKGVRYADERVVIKETKKK